MADNQPSEAQAVATQLAINQRNSALDECVRLGVMLYQANQLIAALQAEAKARASGS